MEQREAIVGSVALHYAIMGVHAELSQFEQGLKLHGVLDVLKRNPKCGQIVMCPIHQPPSVEEFLMSIVEPEYHPEGSNRKEREVDVFMYFTQFLEELHSEGQFTLRGSR